MPRSRSSEMPQRLSPRGPHPLRTSSSDSDPLHHRPITDRSPKLGDRRSPRGDPVNQKKLGTRIADLESQLGQAQGELKVLKDQLASAEAAKKEAQQELENKTKKPARLETVGMHDKRSPTEIQELCDASIVEKQQETDVFEVQVEEETIPAKVEPEPVVHIDEVEKENDDPIVIIAEPQTGTDPENPSLALKDDEKMLLKAKLEEKERELDMVVEENKSLKNELNQATSDAALAKAKEEEMALRLRQLGKEVEETKASAANLKEKLEAADREKEASEVEIKKMRVQTEQWRKAADAAAAVLAGNVEMNGNGGRISERCGSMDKNFGGVFEGTGFVGSPGMGDDFDDGYGSGKRKGSGIKMFGDLWRKRGQK
ncbi:interactor of constitutive active rops 1 [Euphorbia peplus]|nr:interactor of constitutive active rops 1 [Euphorbia peplus]